MHISGQTFTKCATAKPPANTLFSDLDSTAIGFNEMQSYMGLILAMFDQISPMGAVVSVCLVMYTACSGEFSIGFLQSVFESMDAECSFNLSHGRFIKDRERWANQVPCLSGLEPCACPFRRFHLRKHTACMAYWITLENTGGNLCRELLP